MKRCPECRRDYVDDTLLYCLEDGNALVQGAVPSPDEPATAILSTAAAGDLTGPTGETDAKTAILQPSVTAVGSDSPRRIAKPLVAAAAVVIFAGIGFAIYKFVSRTDIAPSFESMKITKLTDTGKAGSAAISPDGKYVVHVKEDGGQQSLWVRHIATGSNVPIVTPAEVEYGRMTFSPDGSYIYFGRREKLEAYQTLYQVPVLGGEPKKMNSNVGSPVTFSPDGKRFAFIRNQQDESTMLIANADGTGEQPLAALNQPESFKTSGAAWSPDGKVIASGAVSDDGSSHIVEVRLEDGAVKSIGSQKWRNVGRVAWLPDASGLIASNFELGSTTSQIYQISYPGGEERKITNDLNSYFDISLMAQSGSMVTVQENRLSNIWFAPDGDAGRARQLTHGYGKSEGRVGVQWTPDGKIVYSSFATGFTPVLSIMNGDGSSPRQLTQSDSRGPAVSPDGRYIVFASLQGGTDGIWRIDIDGANPKQLVNSRGAAPSISPDGRWVIYFAVVSGEARLWKIPIEGGEPVRLTDHESTRPAVSPDGKSIAYLYREQQNSPWRISIIPFEGGQPGKLIDVPPGYNTTQIFAGVPQRLHWLPDGRSLAYIVTRDGISNIWSMPIAGGAPKQLTNFTSDQIAWFDLSRDGKPTLFSRGTTTKDVVMISGFRK